MAILTGRRPGPCEIHAVIGAGGMGEAHLIGWQRSQSGNPESEAFTLTPADSPLGQHDHLGDSEGIISIAIVNSTI